MKSDDRRIEFCVYLNEKDRYKKRPLYKAILESLFDIGVTGASVFDAFAAYGGNFEIKRRSILPWRKNRSLMIKIVERSEMKDPILKLLDERMHGGVITYQDVAFIRYTPTVVTREDRWISQHTSASSLSSSIFDKLP